MSADDKDKGDLRSLGVAAQGADVPATGATRVECQVCGRMLVPLKDGTSRHHYPTRYSNATYRYDRDRCKGSGYRLARWEVGQLLRHHGGSIWVVVEDRGGTYGDYVIRCERGTNSMWRDEWLEEPGKTMVTHGEYMHRHGWTPIAPHGSDPSKRGSSARAEPESAERSPDPPAGEESP